MNKIYKGIIVAGFLCSVQAAYAAPLIIPNTFTANTPAVAADVNANFTATAVAVNDNNTNIGINTTDIGTNTTSIATNATSIGTNTTDIGTNTTSIATNATNIGTNTTDIATNTTSITDIEARLALLEMVTDTSISLANLAGSWGVILNSAGGIQILPAGISNTMEIWRETAYTTATISAVGAVTSTALAGMDITTALNVDGTTTPGIFAQSGMISNTSATGSLSGTVGVGAGNTVTGTINGLSVNGFVSQNGQVIVLEAHDVGIASDKSNVVLTMIKIQ